jgi:predicted metal-dependent phosphoesterase TrpH
VRNDAFSKPGRFYRGNIHTHTTRSDGRRSVEQVTADYRARGYDFVSLTDHFLPNERFHPGEPGFCTVTDTREYNDDAFVTILGAELHGPAMENGEIWHIVAAGLPLDFAPLRDGETGPEVARRARDAGAFVGLAHPYWNAVSEVDALSIVGIIDAVEIYNHGCEVEVARGDGLHMAELLLAKGHRVSLYAADDAHFKHARGTFVDAFGGWVQVKAESLTPEALLTALKAGDYYSSTGPEIHNIELCGDTIRVACSPVESIIVSGLGATFLHVHDVSLVAFEGTVPAADRTPYVRVTVVDAQGRRAWSNPIWLDERR